MFFFVTGQLQFCIVKLLSIKYVTTLNSYYSFNMSFNFTIVELTSLHPVVFSTKRFYPDATYHVSVFRFNYTHYSVFSFVTSAYLSFFITCHFSLLTTTILIWSRMELKPPYDDLHSCSVTYPK
jgi:hypothetical protein